MTATDPPTELTPFQIEVAQRFFAMPESAGFLLAGGAALLAQRLTQRPTQDLDLFTRTANGVPEARDAFEVAARSRGWEVTRIHDGDTFCRLTVTDHETLLIDLALDSPPQLPPTVTFLGPTFAPEELAARKVLALFDRAEARDFADVYQLSKAFQPALLVERAASLDLGFSPELLAQSTTTLSRFRDTDIPIAAAELPLLKAFFAAWTETLKLSS